MGTIFLLPEEVRSKISAGEVIEGPAECVKELMENSLDSGATRVEVEVLKGGKRYILVADNGEGIASEDIERAILGGATSKIRSFEDLAYLRTYGYRGEALHTIASVSKMVLRSRFFQEDMGREIRVEGGNIKNIRSIGMQVGTQVEVFDLFYNLPLRQAFMSREDTERNRIYKVFKLLALANPHVSFTLKAEGRTVMSFTTSQLPERVEDVLGGRYEHLSHERDGIKLNVFLSVEKGKGEVYLFVNRRPVFNRGLVEYLKKLTGKKYNCLCYLELPPYLVDVNVHPKKWEVKLKVEGKIKEMIRETIRKVNYPKPPSLIKQEEVKYKVEPRLIGILEDTLILAVYGDYLYFFDQHLLSERYNYEVKKENPDRACRSSIKAGQKLDEETARELLKRWLYLENREVCPHGRPIYYRLYLGEIYKKLGRSY